MYGTPQLELVSTVIYLILIFLSVIISVMGSMIIISFLTRKEIDEKEEIVKNRNVGIALVFGSFILTLGRMCKETLTPIMNAFHHTFSGDFTLSNTLIFSLSTLGALLIALIIGTVAVFISIKILMVINKDINEWQEIKHGNNAVAIVISVTVFVVGTFFEQIVSYIVMNIFSF